MTRARRIAFGLVILLGAGLTLGYTLYWRPLRYRADIGVGMLAKQICSCVFIGGRAPDDCRADQFSSLDPIPFEVVEELPGVRAAIPFLALERVALYREGLGCALQ